MANENVNPQIIDSLTTTGVTAIGTIPAQAMNILAQGAAASAVLAIQSSQQNAQFMAAIGQSVTTVACKMILSIGGGGGLAGVSASAPPPPVDPVAPVVPPST